MMLGMRAISVKIGSDAWGRLQWLKNRYGQSYSQLVRFALAYLFEHHADVKKAYPTLNAREKDTGRS